MTLAKYNKKRDFNKTSEPVGKTLKQIEKSAKEKNYINNFVVQKHKATRLHYDFRLAFNGVLISFAVPKGMPKEGEKRLAIHVEDHPIEYINFEGKIPKGEYGAGVVKIVDMGQYRAINSFRMGLEIGKLKFLLLGKKFFGIYSLIKLNEKNWLLIKDKQKFLNKKINKKS